MRNEEVESLYRRIDVLEECVKTMASCLQVEIGHVTAQEIIEAIDGESVDSYTVKG